MNELNNAWISTIEAQRDALKVRQERIDELTGEVVDLTLEIQRARAVIKTLTAALEDAGVTIN
jgi:predicted  nucleic acid-binding Zn-ribbon protein